MVKFGGIEMDSERRSWKMSHPRFIAPDSSERQPLVFIMSEHRQAQGKIPLLVPQTYVCGVFRGLTKHVTQRIY